ncbi:sensor histidine kinase [Dickeya chrysanthemi]|uniref:HAMP domain-containing sensor histidine kinase n=1 Tax=Dickeya chrysanthemi TaxID=556 RepID=UPI00039DDD9D|nr:HAMP domain-containing sensor histidine kinase [Dickeya chrysanthemi]
MSAKVNGLRRLLRQMQIKLHQWQAIGVSYDPDFLSTTHFRQSITIVYLFMIVMLGCILGFSVLSESLLRSHVHDIIMNDIYNYAAKSRLKDSAGLSAHLRQEYHEPSDELPMVIVMADDGRLIYHNMPFVPAAGRCQMNVECLKGLLGVGGSDNVMGLAVRLEDGAILFRAYNIVPMLERVRTIPLVAGAGLFLVLMFCLLVSRHFSLRSLNSVRQIREALHRYSTGEQHVRMPVSPYGNDFDGLCVDINQNLERIDRLMTQVRSTAGHVAHELRTPLTHLQNRLYTLAERDDLSDGVRSEIDGASSDVQSVLTLFRNVMRIGEIESGRCVYQFDHFCAQQLLHDLAEYYQPLAEAHQCSLVVELSASIPMFGDRALVFQAMANLIENALKYAAGTGRITLGVHLYHGWLALCVRDHGPGIPPALYQAATERFERLGQAHTQSGYGLGLSLVKAIAELHGGKLALDSAEPGLAAYLCLNRS